MVSKKELDKSLKTNLESEELTCKQDNKTTRLTKLSTSFFTLYSSAKELRFEGEKFVLNYSISYQHLFLLN